MEDVTPIRVRTPGDAASLGTVLGVWAHPDDETYLSAGLMALAAAAGNRVVCVTATRGEEGTDDPDRWPPDRLGLLRERELAAALGALGSIEHQGLGLPDGRCASVPWSVGVSQVMDRIEAVRPDTIVTFGPDGMTGHPDHRAVSSWVTGARALSGTVGAGRLLWATVTADWVQARRAVLDLTGVFGADDPPVIDEGELALAVELDDDWADRKLVALRAHASQTRALEGRIGTDALRSWWSLEQFREATDPDAPPADPSTATRPDDTRRNDASPGRS